MTTLPVITPINKFTDSKIQAAIDAATERMLPGSTWAMVAHVNGSGVDVSAIKRIGAHLSVEGAALYPYGGKLEAEAELVWQG